MIDGIEIAEVNPIPLSKNIGFEWYSDEYYQTCYLQKFEPTDKTALQLLGNASLTVNAYLTNRYGRNIGNVEVSYPASGIDGVYLAELRPDFSTIDFDDPENPICEVRGTILKSGSAYNIRSRPILIRKVAQSCFLEYSSTENANSVIFTTGIKFGLRIEGGFIPKSYIPASDDTIYKDEAVNFVSLKSAPYNSYAFKAGKVTGIPDWLHSIVNRAFSCNMLYADGIQIVKTEDAEWTSNDIENYDLREWSINISKAVNSGVYKIVSDLLAYWSSYYCVLDRQLYSYAVHVDDRTAKLSGAVTLTVEKTDGSTYDMVKAYKGFGDVVFEVPVDDTVTGAVMTASGSLDTANVQVLGSTRPLFERSARVSSTALPATVVLLPAGTRIGKDGSSMLHVIINQPL